MCIRDSIRPNAGEIIYEGKSYREMNPILSQKLGIGVIYQEFNLVPELSIAENIFLGNKLTKGLTINRKMMNQKAREIMEGFGIKIDVTKPVRSLTVEMCIRDRDYGLFRGRCRYVLQNQTSVIYGIFGLTAIAVGGGFGSRAAGSCCQDKAEWY